MCCLQFRLVAESLNQHRELSKHRGNASGISEAPSEVALGVVTLPRCTSRSTKTEQYEMWTNRSKSGSAAVPVM